MQSWIQRRQVDKLLRVPSNLESQANPGNKVIWERFEFSDISQSIHQDGF